MKEIYISKGQKLNNIDAILKQDSFSKDDIVKMLSVETEIDMEKLRTRANEVLMEHVGEKIFLRGLVEFSNICALDCNYCGIRKSNKNVHRYQLEKDEVVSAAKWCAERGYGSLVLQSGERTDKHFVDYVCDLLRGVKEASKSEQLPNGLGITLSIGEQSKEDYQRLFDAGAHRFLLRIESTNRTLFDKIHPHSQSFEKRIEAMQTLREVGYQVGTGVMIGLPDQTLEDLAGDILFFKEQDVDMIGMGPYLVHRDTPMADYYATWLERKDEITKLALKMIATTRIVLKDVNIASTTALETIHPSGKEKGLLHGANVIMPMLTPESIRANYKLYEGKPTGDNFKSEQGKDTPILKIAGREVNYGSWGDSKHFANRNK